MLLEDFACGKAAVDESDIRIVVTTKVLSFIGSRQYNSRLALKLLQRLQQQLTRFASLAGQRELEWLCYAEEADRNHDVTDRRMDLHVPRGLIS
jgi:hypothetical protein